MDKNMNINPNQLDALLKIAGKKLGTTPERLKSQLESGKFDNAMGNMSQSQSEMFKKALSDPEFAKKLLSTPQAQELYKKLGK